MAKYEKQFLMEMLENLWTVRKFEECAGDSSLKGEIMGNVHVCTGQEGGVVGAEMALNEGDYITASHRGHGHCVMKSGDVDHTMAELFGRETGFCHGRGGSMHVTKAESGLLGANGIVGGGISLATGSALASKLLDDKSVTVAFFGDGASNQGCFHECLNMAAMWDLPVIFFVENNGYAVSTPITYSSNTPSLADRAAAYGIEGIEVNGTDVLAVYECVKEAADKVRNGSGPVLIDCKLYKFTGHFVGDPAAYLPEEYKKEALAQDPVIKFRNTLIADGSLTEEEADLIEQKASDKISKAREFALASPLPQAADVEMYNYSSDNERCVAR